MEKEMTIHMVISCMKDFTHTYSEYSGDIYKREAMCLEKQMCYMMLPPKKEDLLAGGRQSCQSVSVPRVPITVPAITVMRPL